MFGNTEQHCLEDISVICDVLDQATYIYHCISIYSHTLSIDL